VESSNVSAELSNRLGFLDLVTEHFSFLASERFQQTVSADGTVVYQSGDVWLSIKHGRLDYTLELGLGRQSVPEEAFTLHEVVQALCPARTAGARWQASDRESLGKGVEKIANLVNDCVAPLLDGDSSSFQKVASVAQEMRHSVTLDAQYGPIRKRANQAWEEKNSQEAYRLYSQMREALSESEKRRFSYLANKLGRGS